MKNKSKLKKIKEKKQESGVRLREWLYMSHQSMSVREIQQVFAEDPQIRTEIWPDAGVLEVILKEGSSMDFEQGSNELTDPYSRKFLEANQVETYFYVTLGREAQELAEKQMKRIVEALGGFFCGDTQDFRPGIGEVHFI